MVRTSLPWVFCLPGFWIRFFLLCFFLLFIFFYLVHFIFTNLFSIYSLYNVLNFVLCIRLLLVETMMKSIMLMDMGARVFKWKMAVLWSLEAGVNIVSWRILSAGHCVAKLG